MRYIGSHIAHIALAVWALGLPGILRAQQTSLPVVRLHYTTLSKDTFSAGSFQLVDSPDSLSLACQVRHRGATSTKYAKKSYAVKLLDSKAQKKDTSLLGMREDNYWILDAMAVDKARMRNRVGMDLWLDCSTKPSYTNQEPKVCNGYHGKFVEVYVNDSYEGIYCLMERVDRKQLKLKKFKSKTINGVLYKSVSWAGSFFGDLTPYDNQSATWMRYEYEYPEVEDSLITWEPLYEAMSFVNTASAESFANEAANRYDIPVFIDYYLFTTLLSARDNCGKNLFLSYYNLNANSKLLITPWDLDHSFGRMWNAEKEAADEACWGEDNLYKRLADDLPQYLTQLLERYASLRQSFWSLDNLKQRFASYFRLFKLTHADQREEERWSGVDNIDLDFAAEEEYIYSWLEDRLHYTDSLFQYTDVSAVEDIQSPSAETRKIMRDGQILILRKDKIYTVTGILVAQ